MEDNKEEMKLTPSAAFKAIKDAKTNIATEDLKNSYQSFVHLADKYSRTGQSSSMNRLFFLLKTLEKEEKILEMGINKFVYKDVIEDYVNAAKDNAIKVVELKNYTREIPDDIVSVIDKTKDIFDEFFVVFTDYTGKEERKIEQKKRDRDPILFGAFCDLSNNRNRFVADRFYVLGDWVDEYCDLTLDKFVMKYQNKNGEDPVNKIEIPSNIEELKEILSKYKETADTVSANDIDGFEGLTNAALPIYRIDKKQKPKKPFIEKVRSFLNLK